MSSLRLLSYALVLSFVPSLASADEPKVTEWARKRVDQGLVQPLTEKENDGPKFSRSRPAPRERKARITQAAPSADDKGREFLTFSVDVRFGGGEWHADDIVGCVYTKTGELYVKRGDTYRPAAFLLGKKADPVAGVCGATPPAARS